ncbi:hypothetical protein L798_08102 [Zootermopsis nevadensis]|uniref:Uncharacterized protein n=1 Tax=Zootermopsis nevadensis TaxID=136037 RepID=A0A067R1T0_ZOONE|nr:hypothetical protein L798_08102 [Zootermopsis nevadensis]
MKVLGHYSIHKVSPTTLTSSQSTMSYNITGNRPRFCATLCTNFLKLVEKLIILKDVEGSGRVLFEVLSQHLPAATEENTRPSGREPKRYAKVSVTLAVFSDVSLKFHRPNDVYKSVLVLYEPGRQWARTSYNSFYVNPPVKEVRGTLTGDRIKEFVTQ